MLSLHPHRNREISAKYSNFKVVKLRKEEEEKKEERNRYKRRRKRGKMGKDEIILAPERNARIGVT